MDLSYDTNLTQNERKIKIFSWERKIKIFSWELGKKLEFFEINWIWISHPSESNAYSLMNYLR